MRQFRLAQTGEGIKECELVQWFVQEGDEVEEFGRVCEVQSDKATIEISSPYAGVVRKLHHKPGDVVQVGDVLADIHTGGDEEAPAAAASSGAAAAAGGHAPRQAGGAAAPSFAAAGVQYSSSGDEQAWEGKVLTSPAVRHLAKQYGINLSQVPATGPGGRVLKGDVLAYIEGMGGAATAGAAGASGVGGPSAAAAEQAAAAAAPSAAAAGEESMEPVVVQLRGYRKAMVRHMTASAAIPHFHFCEEAAGLALRDWPFLNASLSADQGSVACHRHVNIGVAMATPHGLVVPNIKHVQSKTVLEIAAELVRLQDAAAANHLSQADISGGTFTISNIGTIGGTYATPLVNPPEVAIMAVGRVQRLPRFAEDGFTVVPSSIMSMSLGADHRVVDGAALAGFASTWRQYVESPGRLLLHLR
ncbi:hypothetical protein COHA_004077 [Chlorella ohadii]|uniref:Dihydrolipoamide acetyltransferase component of pyruvate dehydrogenase complex n=1 Tax=Chlorella ohadii TaxID=2649997 RepID=A0AAD5DTY1_9CHLO|nr:hypothetical protein COHA_004077 [Chlorella ohadii]